MQHLEKLKVLEGKWTHVLVGLAILAYVWSVASTPNGIMFSMLSAEDLSYIFLIGCISAFKEDIERAIRAE